MTIKMHCGGNIFYLQALCNFVTAGSRKYYVYWYEGNLNGIEVLISYPKDAFHVPKALPAVIIMDVSLSTREILDKYV